MQSRIKMYTAVDEDGSPVRVARIVPRFRVVRLEQPGIVEGPPQWLTEVGERVDQVSDTVLQVVGSRRRLQMVK